MLALVLADRHGVGLVEQDVRRLQHGIGVETRAGLLAVLARLDLELRHAVQPTHRRHTVENPRQLGVLVHMRLDEERAALRVHATGEERRGEPADADAQLGGILRERDGVQIHDAIDVLVDILLVHPVADSAEIVADVRDAGGLDAGEDALAFRRFPLARWRQFCLRFGCCRCRHCVLLSACVFAANKKPLIHLGREVAKPSWYHPHSSQRASTGEPRADTSSSASTDLYRSMLRPANGGPAGDTLRLHRAARVAAHGTIRRGRQRRLALSRLAEADALSRTFPDRC